MPGSGYGLEVGHSGVCAGTGAQDGDTRASAGIGLPGGYDSNQLVAIAGLGDHDQVGGFVDQGFEPGTDYQVIIGEEDASRHWLLRS